MPFIIWKSFTKCNAPGLDTAGSSFYCRIQVIISIQWGGCVSTSIRGGCAQTPPLWLVFESGLALLEIRENSKNPLALSSSLGATYCICSWKSDWKRINLGLKNGSRISPLKCLRIWCVHWRGGLSDHLRHLRVKCLQLLKQSQKLSWFVQSSNWWGSYSQGNSLLCHLNHVHLWVVPYQMDPASPQQSPQMQSFSGHYPTQGYMWI